MATITYLVACFICLLSFPAAQSAGKSYLGKDFVFGLLPVWRENLVQGIKISLEIGSKDSGSMTLTVPFLNINGKQYQLQQDGYQNITIDTSMLVYRDLFSKHGLSIQSTVDISVLVTYALLPCCGMASYRVFPVPTLDRLYEAASPLPATNISPSHLNYLMVVAVENNTEVVVSLSNGTSNYYAPKIMNELEVYQIQYPAELTGTLVTSNNNPIAVFSGSSFAQPSGYVHGAAMLAQMIPYKSWDKSFIVTPGEPADASFVEILNWKGRELFATASNGTMVQDIQHNTVQPGPGSYMVTNNIPIQPVQYNGEFMTLVPGVSHYMNEYSFVLPVVKSENLLHVLKAVVPANQNGCILIDGKPFVGEETTLDTPHGQYTIVKALTTEGFHHVVHTNPSVKFGLLAFGWDHTKSRYWFAYGFYVGLTFDASSVATSGTSHYSSAICPIRTTESTTTTTTTSTTTTTPVPTTPTPATTPTITTTRTTAHVQSSGRMCYSCHDMDQLQFCDVVQRCALNQVCYVKKHLVGGFPIYSSGCQDLSMCTSSQDSCTECCSNNFCNNHGCGDSGIAPRDQRGPLCFQCQHISSPERCPTLTLCGANQQCSIEEFKWGSLVQYKVGCASNTCTPAKRATDSQDERMSRAVPSRHACCTGDYCNRNTTVLNAGYTGTGIIG